MMATASTRTVTPFEESMRGKFATLLAQGPDWLQALRREALGRFDVLGMPTRRQEAWKYVNLRPLMETAFQPYAPASVGLLDLDMEHHWISAVKSLSAHENQAVCRLIFVNGRYVPELSVTACPADAGVTIRSLRAACEEFPQWVQPELQRAMAEETDPFVPLNTALFEDGAFIHVQDDAAGDPLIQLLFINTQSDAAPRAAFLRNMFLVGRNARLNLVLQSIGTGRHQVFHNTVQDYVLKENARLNVTYIQNEARSDWHFASSQAVVQDQAKLSLSTVSFGGHVSRNSIRVLFKGEGAECQLNGLDVLDGQSEVYHHTVMEHWVPRCVSNQYYKGILDDAAKSEFNGLVFVAQGAIGTDSQQMNKNLVLSENARVWTRPQLQINADDVKCAHGATVGQLEDEQLFYLASRGLDADTATSLLTYGFAEEIIQRVPQPAVREYLDTWLLANLHQSEDGVLRQLARPSSSPTM